MRRHPPCPWMPPSWPSSPPFCSWASLCWGLSSESHAVEIDELPWQGRTHTPTFLFLPVSVLSSLPSMSSPDTWSISPPKSSPESLSSWQDVRQCTSSQADPTPSSSVPCSWGRLLHCFLGHPLLQFLLIVVFVFVLSRPPVSAHLAGGHHPHTLAFFRSMHFFVFGSRPHPPSHSHSPSVLLASGPRLRPCPHPTPCTHAPCPW